MENYMNIDPDVLEEVKELMEHGLEQHSWPFIEDALAILKEGLGYEVREESDDDNLEEE